MRLSVRRALRLPERVFFGWYIALGGALSNFLVIGIVAFGFGIFIKPMRDELGWSVTAISIGVSLRSFEQGLLAPATGALVDRLGPRRMGIVGVIALSTGLLMFSQARNLPMFYASSLVLALGQSLGSFTPFSVAIMSWFRRKRGRAMGILNTGNGAGYLAAPILAASVSLVGWRMTLVIAALVILALGLPLTALLRDRPEDRGLRPDGDLAPSSDPGSPAPGTQLSGMSAADALRTPVFYLLVLANASNGTMGAWIVHQIPHLENVGFSRETAALLSGLYGLIQIGLRTGVGWLGDAVGRKRLYALSFVLQGVGMIVFANLTAGRAWMLPFYYLTFATGQAAYIIFQQTMVADYFGVRRFATLRGFASTMQLPVGVLAPVIAGWAFDRYGTYVTVFTIYGLVTATGAIYVLLIRRPLWVHVDS